MEVERVEAEEVEEVEEVKAVDSRQNVQNPMDHARPTQLNVSRGPAEQRKLQFRSLKDATVFRSNFASDPEKRNGMKQD
jgi:hypothetical protein